MLGVENTNILDQSAKFSAKSPLLKVSQPSESLSRDFSGEDAGRGTEFLKRLLDARESSCSGNAPYFKFLSSLTVTEIQPGSVFSIV